MGKNASLLCWLAISLTVTLTGCGNQPQASQDIATTTPVNDTPARPFSSDTLYTLLVAETAANRGQLDIALANYYQQAYKTRDVGVVRRATLLAEYLQAPQAALDLAQLWSDIEPQNPEPVYLAGRYLVNFQRLDLAVQKSKRLLELDAQTLFVPIALSPAASDAKTQADLKKEYEPLLQLYPDSTDLLLGYAALLELQGNYDDSLSHVERVLKINDKDLQARLFEIDILYKSGRPDKALKRMAAVVEDDPENNRLRMQYAQMLTEQDLEKAREQFEYMAQRNSLDPDLLLSRALVNYKLNDRVQAKDLFEQLLFLKKYTDTAQYYLGEISLAEQAPSKALEHYRRVEGGNEYLLAVARAFNLMIELNKRSEGQQWLVQQRNAHPDQALRLYIIEANVLLKHGDTARSLAALNEAIKKYPEQPELYFARSLLLEKMGNLPAAETDLRFVLSKQPDNVDALNALGYMLANSNQQLDESYQLLSKALTLHPDDAAILDSMGWALYRMGRQEEAILRLKKSFNLDPNDEVAAHLGEVLWNIGKHDEAAAIWQQGLRLKPGSDIITTTRKRLQAP
ncbi:MAG TPA: tetratricopeptide repeat protein [Pseudomonadales bacterium]|nr:tetratricopeptide repeat protein [Pseudomonadales bacterium]